MAGQCRLDHEVEYFKTSVLPWRLSLITKTSATFRGHPAVHSIDRPKEWRSMFLTIVLAKYDCDREELER